MDFARAFRELKFNPNHDPNSGEFSDGGATGDGGGGKTATTPKVVGENAFSKVGSADQFEAWAKGQWSAQGTANWKAHGRNMGMSSDELALHNAYFGNGFQETNAFLRTPDASRSASEQTRLGGQVATVLAAFDKNGVDLPAGALVFRGVHDQFASALSNLKKGDTFEDRAFTSTTPVLSMAVQFGGGEAAFETMDEDDYSTSQVAQPWAVLRIRTTKDERVLPSIGEEAEVLFKPGHKFKYLGKQTARYKGVDFQVYDVDMS